VLEPVAANAAVTAALDTVSGMTQTSGVSVTFDQNPETPTVRANADRLRQVLINVLSNAVKYNQASHPTISVRSRNDKNKVLVDIIDNGGGVSKEDLTMVFEKFARGSHTSTNYGAGLGLPISRAIMRAMDGDLTVEFNNDGTSYFRLILEKVI